MLINTVCIVFNGKQHLEEYDVTIDLNSTLSEVDVIGPNSIYFSWLNKDVYNEKFSFPNLVDFVSSDCK